jgi:hypothetical protein
MAEITREEYQKYMNLRDSIIKGIEDSESEFMVQTYSMLHRVMNKRTKAALALNIQLENKEVREKRQAKLDTLRPAKERD